MLSVEFRSILESDVSQVFPTTVLFIFSESHLKVTTILNSLTTLKTLKFNLVGTSLKAVLVSWTPDTSYQSNQLHEIIKFLPNSMASHFSNREKPK